MLEAFEAQIATGGPLTVTHPEVTRFFMTVHEAVQLVIQAGAVGDDGEALVLDMGEPVRIADVARRLAADAPQRVEIVFTGLRPGEKLHEVLFGTGEIGERPAHPKIAHVVVPPLQPEPVITELTCADSGLVVDQLREISDRDLGSSEDLPRLRRGRERRPPSLPAVRLS